MNPNPHIPIELSSLFQFFSFCAHSFRYFFTSTMQKTVFANSHYDEIGNFSSYLYSSTTGYAVTPTPMKTYTTSTSNTACSKAYSNGGLLSYGFELGQDDMCCLLGAYRFGFNSQEKVDEIAGLGNHNTALFWEYDTRLGRRWNLDPVVKPWESDYATFRNNPLIFADPDGKDGIAHFEDRNGQKTLIVKATYFTNQRGISQDIQDKVHKKLNTYTGNVYYKGEKVKVEFQVDFVTIPVDKKPDDIAGIGISDDFNEGLNTFKFTSGLEVGGGSALGAANRRGIEIDYSVLSEGYDDPDYAATVLVEEIGHNIGFLHTDVGPMSQDITKGVSTGNMTRFALQKFVNRLDGMTKAESSESYWKQSNEISEREEETTGTTRIKAD
ncbi:MAG: hypothetical protein PHT69_05245 [Bacteroidales bacterium]|nr:hypothetical protein [Bacteroidales bacterium]